MNRTNPFERNQLVVLGMTAGMIATLASSACGGLDPDGRSTTTESLSLGSQGPAVRSLYGRLNQVGYFPNADLARDFPNWRPVVPVAPASADVFDDSLRIAVTKYQRLTGLPPTGVADAATLSAIYADRCGNPDLDPDLNPQDKYDLVNSVHKWTKARLNYRWLGSPTTAQKDDFTTAAYNWSTVSNFVLASVTTGFDFSVNMCTPGAVGCALPAPPPGQTGAIGMTKGTLITISSSLNQGDRLSVMRHEIGHMLGLAHSGYKTAIMYCDPRASANGTGDIQLDDKVAIRNLYGAWSQYPGAAIDISAGTPTFAVGTDVDANGDGTLFQFNPTSGSWVSQNKKARRVTTGHDGRLWAVTGANQIIRRNGTTWQTLPGAAVDIGAYDAIWIIGTNTQPSGDAGIYRWNEAAFTWDQMPGVAHRIAVDSSNRAVVSQAAGNIYRWNPSINNWDGNPGLASDVGAGGSNQVWVTATDNISGGHSIWFWDEQPSGPGDPPAQALATWIKVPGGARDISVGFDGAPWAVNSNNAIFRFLVGP